MSSSSFDRRDFLLSAGVFAAGMLGASPLAAAALSQEGDGGSAQSASRPQAEPPNRSRNWPGVTRQTIAEAEKLAGISFTDAERDMIVSTIGEQIGFLNLRRKQPYFPNSLAPACVFNPLSHDGAVRLGARDQRVIVRSSADPGPLPTDDTDIAYAPVTQLSRWVERRQLTSARLTEIYLERLRRFDPQLNCVITLCENRARRQAARADAEIVNGHYRGPLHGIPWGAKDLFDTKGIRTTWGAEPFMHRVPDADAAVVSRLDEAGAVLVAKLSLGALAYNDIWFGGRTNNPWNLQQGSSGSSAGSAAATAAGLVGFSLGTETYGSIVSPCMRCGTTGLRPTFGRVSRAGAMSLCWSLDKVGPICRTVEDCMLVLLAINWKTGEASGAGDPAVLDQPLNFNADRKVAGLRVGFDPAWFSEKDAVPLDFAALAALEKAGARLTEIHLPDWPYESLLAILLAEAAAAFEELTRTNRDDELAWQEPEAWPNTFRKAWFIPAIDLVQADRLRRRCMNMLGKNFTDLDAIVSPSFAASLCLLTNNTGHPSLTLRTGFNENGTPHGITLIGKLFDEGTLCSLGMALEHQLNVWQERPRIG